MKSYRGGDIVCSLVVIMVIIIVYKFIFKQDNIEGFESNNNSLDSLVLDNNINPKIEFKFQGCFPTSLGAIQFDSSMTDADSIMCDVVFAYRLFEMVRL